MLRKVGLFVVMVGALALSFSGQVDAVSPLLGDELAVVFAATNDVAALLALNEVASSSPGSIRRWAWSVLLLAGGTALGLNTWHALQAGVLPIAASVAVGAGPVVLAWLLSHLVALVLTEQRKTTVSASETASAPEQPEGVSVPVGGSVDTAAATVAEADRQAADSVERGASVAAQPASTAVDPVGDGMGEQALESREAVALPALGERVASSLPVRLVDQAEKLERQALHHSGGKRGLSFREAPRRLGVRYDTARAALQAARERIAAEGTDIASESDNTHEFGSRTAA